jgi:hypothetical protein
MEKGKIKAAWILKKLITDALSILYGLLKESTFVKRQLIWVFKSIARLLKSLSCKFCIQG